MGKIGDEGAIDSLMIFFEEHRSDIIDALADIQGRRVSDILLSTLASDPGKYDLIDIVEYFGKIRERRAIAPLMQLLDHSDKDIVRPAAASLAKMEELSGIPTLIKCLGDGSGFCDSPSQTCHWLIEIGPPCVPYLVGILQSTDNKVRLDAVRALVEIDDPGSADTLKNLLKDPFDKIRYLVSNWMLSKEDNPDAADVLYELLDMPDSFWRSWVVSALVKYKNPRYMDGLVHALEDDNPQIRIEAVHGLKELGNKVAVFALIKALEDEIGTIRQGAAMALGEIGDPSALEPLKKQLGDPDPDVLIAVRRALKLINEKIE